MQSLFQLRYRRSIPSINNAGPTIRSHRRSTARWIANITVVGADQDDAEMLAEELRKFPAETVRFFIWARCRSCPSLARAGFRTAWKDDPREVNFICQQLRARSRRAAV